MQADVTELLQAWSGGDRAALDRLMPLVYDELKRIAARHLAGERAGHTLQATALVHEAYLKLVDQRSARWQNRTQFFAVAAQLMRRILVDHARAHAAAKRGAGARPVTLSALEETGAQPDLDIVALDAALDRLAVLDPRQARVVELRYFGGLSLEETAAVVEASPATIKRDWAMARAWLYQQLAPPA